MVVDTSILLAIFFNEKSGPWAADQLQQNRRDLQMSTVNYAEALILIQDRQPHLFAEIREAIESSSIRLVAPTPELAETAAAARWRYPLNLGDCFAFALAKHEDSPLLTLDADFRRVDVAVVRPKSG
ncbi:MAG TPA: type II toxin-antitoxin system VapC family toxin [Bryobacteraceae bacterium]|nr:type II toxin-antitoxin system VapC family toxin [Bryobacteraceae bacterium]